MTFPASEVLKQVPDIFKDIVREGFLKTYEEMPWIFYDLKSMDSEHKALPTYFWKINNSDL